MRPPPSGSTDFVIQGGGNTFVSKQQQLSALLSQAAKDCNKDETASSLSQNEMEILRGRKGVASRPRPFAKQNRSEMRQYRGKESLFKRPEGPAPISARRSIADYHRNPHKWVKYSLDDVQNDQMSDRSNAQAAFSFLNELRARKSKERCKEADDDSMDTTEPDSDSSVVISTSCKFTARIPFRKSSESKNKEEPRVVVVEHDDKPVFRNSKIILPEYVVGQKKEKKVKKIKPVGKIDRSKQMKLSHLEEIDENHTNRSKNPSSHVSIRLPTIRKN